MLTMTILILDENNFYAEGLRELIYQHFQMSPLKLHFIRSIKRVKYPDLVFFSSGINAAEFFKCIVPGKMSVQAFFIAEKEKSQSGNTFLIPPWIRTLKRHASVLDVLNQLRKPDQKLPRYKKSCSNIFTSNRFSYLLTERETEILNYIALGISGCQISGIIGISEKTVSTHKRNAMKRLGLTSNQQLFHWLINTSQRQI